ncbi:hypothetical protein M885DRAFT_207056 [Pelagophyceae sp. CCMP2097]|nr:hypothetical protein M885DRAFT_207056 [Pelagophyceae sp. CCMP2097]
MMPSDVLLQRGLWRCFRVLGVRREASVARLVGWMVLPSCAGSLRCPAAEYRAWTFDGSLHGASVACADAASCNGLVRRRTHRVGGVTVRFRSDPGPRSSYPQHGAKTFCRRDFGQCFRVLGERGGLRDYTCIDRRRIRPGYMIVRRRPLILRSLSRCVAYCIIPIDAMWHMGCCMASIGISQERWRSSGRVTPPAETPFR